MAVHIVTDTACDLPKHLIEEYDIKVMPFIVIIDGEEYVDGDTIGPDELYKQMKEGKVPTTSQVPSERMRHTFEALAEKNESCIYIGLSSELTGTYQSAVSIAQELKERYPGFDIDTVDSRGASIGQGLMVLEAAQMAKEGQSKANILRRIQFNIDHMEYLFTVDDLVYLQRGGRIGRASAFLGGLLNIKPLLELEDGRLIPLEKIRGSKKVYRRLVDLVKERGNDLERQTIALCHADCPDSMQTLKTMIQEETGAKRFIEVPIGGVIGSHAGPGTFAVIFRSKIEQ